jgi:hypothetical protein
MSSKSRSEDLTEVRTKVYDKCSLLITNLSEELEGKEYNACQFELSERRIILRSSKITPKKVGQFVTFWKRNEKGVTEPFKETDKVDFFVINARSNDSFGQFVFPKYELIRKGILSTENKDGKRGFRVYPKWDKPQSKQAAKTQNWQLDYFYEIDSNVDTEKVLELYNRR